MEVSGQLHAPAAEIDEILVGKPDRMRPLGRPRHRWENNIRMDLKEIGNDVDWIHLAQDKG
jgi:hypothetical protein